MVREAGPQVCVFPINGTRRWFMLEYGDKHWADPLQAFLDISAASMISLMKLIFDHGIDTLLIPTIGPDILLRKGEYMASIGKEGLLRLAQGVDFMTFYEEYNVRVHFYGNYKKKLASTPYAGLSTYFDQAAGLTKSHTRCRLFYGVFGNDATEAVAEYAVNYYLANGCLPHREAIVSMYYGETIEPATFFIGFDKLSAFDFPLLNLGEEDLYFTVSPSAYLTQEDLRLILHDHLFTRKLAELDYNKIGSKTRTKMRSFYHANRHTIIGAGAIKNGIWCPIPADEICNKKQ